MSSKRERVISSLFLLFLLAMPVLGEATHFVGGNLRYDYVGKFGGDHRYEVQLTTYVNCGPNSLIPYPEPNHDIGVYEHDKSNPNDDKDLYSTINVQIQDTIKITPENPSGCGVGDDACIRKGIFKGTVDVPSSLDGYHLYFHRCCRNGSINNLANPGDEATSFHAYIPPTPVENSSPTFSKDPVPFICVGDTTTILNSAVDPDGDKLVFSFVDPYSSRTATDVNPDPPPPDPLEWPIPAVDWGAGYGVNQPFGSGGHAYINGNNGLTEYMIPNQGRWVVGIEIKEYRNGDLVGISRRDLQLLSIDCPGNPSPNLSSSGGSGKTSYTIQEGDSLCFPIEFQDPNGDSLELSAQGPLFDSSKVDPNATIDTPAVGDSIVQSQFCWGTSCGQGRALPYRFSVSATDDGCPPKTTDVIYEIEVEPPEAPSSISGPDPVCAFDQGATYSIDTTGGYNYDWSVSGGSISGGNGHDTVKVDWNSGGSGSLKVHGISPNGCLSDSITRTVTINSLPDADAGNDTSVCKGDSMTIGGSPTGPGGANYTWNPGKGLDDSSIANPKASPDDTTRYIVEVTDLSGCTARDTVEVKIKNPTMEAGPDTSICQGDSVKLGTKGADSVEWQSSYALSDSSVSDPWAYPDSSVEYRVFLYDSTSSCSYYDTVSVRVDSLPVVDAGNDTTICDNESTALGGSPTGPPGSSYLWEPPSSLDDSSLANPTAAPNDTTKYGVTVTDTNGCQARDSVLVSVPVAPTADAGNNDSICLGDSTQLNGSGGGSYTWSPSDSLSDSSIADPDAFPDDTTEYRLIVSDTNGCSDTDRVEIVVHPLPTAEAGPDKWLCPGDSTILEGSGGGDYAWSPAGSLDDSTLKEPSAYPADTTDYRLEVTDSNGCKDRDSTRVFVNSEVPIDPGTADTICPGDSTVLGGSPTAPAGTDFTWSPAASLNDPNLANPKASPDTTTTYYLDATNDTCTNTDSVTVYVDTLPSADAGPDQEICAGDSTTLNGSGGVAFDWTPSSGLSDSSIADPTASPNDTTDYILTVTGANGCTAKDTATVRVNPHPTAAASSDTSICRGDTTLLTASGGSAYQWSPSDSLSAPNDDSTLAWPDSSRSYQVVVTDTNGCKDTASLQLGIDTLPDADAGPDTSICIGDSADLQATGGNDYAWTPGSSLSDSTIADPSAGPNDTTRYSVKVTDNNACSAFDTVKVNVLPLPNVDAGSDTGICIYDSTELSASGASSYVWTPGDSLTDSTVADPIAFPDATTKYDVRGTDSAGCSNIDSVRITVHPRPPVDAGSDREICRGDTTTLNGSGANSYVWTPDKKLSDPTVQNPNAWPDTTRSYVLEGSDVNGCINTDTVEVAVYRIDAGPDTSICRGDSVQLFAYGPNTSSYTWSPSNGLSDSSIATPMAGPDSSIVYTVSGTDTKGCEDEDSVEVLLVDAPTADFDTSMEAVCDGQRWTFQDRSRRNDSSAWKFEGRTVSGEEVEETFPYGEEGEAMLIAVNEGKCRDTSRIRPEIPPFEEYFEARKPNVFTPNGDGRNDVFYLETNGSFNPCTEMHIYNRWGQLLFKSSGNNPRWDAHTSAGKKVAPGTYFYTLVVKGVKIEGEIHILE